MRLATNVTLGAFEDLVGGPLSATQRVQAEESLRAGGCGIRTAESVRPAARMAALLSFVNDAPSLLAFPEMAFHLPSSLVDPVLAELTQTLGSNFDPLTSWRGDHSKLRGVDRSMFAQHWWSDQLGKARMLSLLDSATPRDQARLLEQQDGLGTSWMTVTPSAQLHSLIPASDYVLGLRWWLGMSIVSQDDPEVPPLCPGCQKKGGCAWRPPFVLCSEQLCTTSCRGARGIVSGVGARRPCLREGGDPPGAEIGTSATGRSPVAQLGGG